MYSNRKRDIVRIFYNITVLLYFCSNTVNAALMSIKDLNISVFYLQSDLITWERHNLSGEAVKCTTETHVDFFFLSLI